MYMRVFEGMKGKGEMPWLYYNFKDKYKQTNKLKHKDELAGFCHLLCIVETVSVFLCVQFEEPEKPFLLHSL